MGAGGEWSGPKDGVDCYWGVNEACFFGLKDWVLSLVGSGSGGPDSIVYRLGNALGIQDSLAIGKSRVVMM